jgi:hypothetical protein
MAVSRTGTPLASSEQQASIQVGAIDNSLSWPWKHPDAVSFSLCLHLMLHDTDPNNSGEASHSDGSSCRFP